MNSKLLVKLHAQFEGSDENPMYSIVCRELCTVLLCKIYMLSTEVKYVRASDYLIDSIRV